MKAVLRHLRAAALCCKGEGPSDGQLLDSFLLRHEETAFEALVRRHGAMVFGVCRRILRNVHDAEDAFQATFLVLSRKAATVKPKDMVGNWLYGVAYRTALKARAMNAKRRAKERQAGAIPHSEAGDCDEVLLEQLDHELSRLPDKYRVPVVLCELEGRSRKEVSRFLGVPEGTLSWRLAQAKKLLAKRLSRHGRAVSGSVLAAVLAPNTASACLRASTVRTVLSAGKIPAQVLALTEGVLKAMLLTKLKITVCAATLMLAAGVAATGLTYRATAEEPKRPTFATFSTRYEDSRPGADDLESLRLEIEALRKELRATRERVRALEEAMSGQKGRNAAGPQEPLRSRTKERTRSDLDRQLESARRALEMERGALRGKIDADKLHSEIEAALKKALEKIDDKQITEAIEKALKNLKEQEKSKPFPRERKD